MRKNVPGENRAVLVQKKMSKKSLQQKKFLPACIHVVFTQTPFLPLFRIRSFFTGFFGFPKMRMIKLYIQHFDKLQEIMSFMLKLPVTFTLKRENVLLLTTLNYPKYRINSSI